MWEDMKGKVEDDDVYGRSNADEIKRITLGKVL